MTEVPSQQQIINAAFSALEKAEKERDQAIDMADELAWSLQRAKDDRDKAERRLADLLLAVHELILSNDASLGIHRPRSDIAWRNLQRVFKGESL